MQAERAGGTSDVALVTAQRLLDASIVGRVKRLVAGQRGRRRLIQQRIGSAQQRLPQHRPSAFRQVTRLDATGRLDGGVLDCAADLDEQLANVARPGSQKTQLHQRRVYRRRGRGPLHRRIDEPGNLLDPLAQRGNVNRRTRDAIVQILAKASLCDQDLQVFVGGRAECAARPGVADWRRAAAALSFQSPAAAWPGPVNRDRPPHPRTACPQQRPGCSHRHCCPRRKTHRAGPQTAAARRLLVEWRHS